MTLAQFLNTFWGTLVIVAQVISVFLIVAHISPNVRKSSLALFFKDKSMIIALIATFCATAGSLIYSDVLGYEPCKLCWIQRIFMYPQVLLLGVALWRKEYFIKFYAIILSVIGGAVAIYHYIGQLGLTPLPCSAVGISVSCSVKFVMQYGYITIPMMAFAVFVLVALVLSLSLRKE